MPYYVYILLCKDGSYYTGHAKDVKQRIGQHRRGQGARYTRMHQPEETVYLEQFNSRSKAMKREQEIKSLNHQQKRQLIDSCNKSTHASSKDICH